MGEPLIWTCEDMVRFTYEPDDYDRSWAWCWLGRHHPAEASRHAARAIRDPSPGVVCSGIEIFMASETNEGREAVEELKRRSDLARSVKKLLDLLEHPERRKSRDPFDEEIEQLARRRAELRREAPAMLRSRLVDPVLVALGALGFQQHQWASDILVDALPVLLTGSSTEIVWDTFDSLRDPRSLPAIEAAWTPGEHDIADLYVRIHHLAGGKDPLPRGIALDAEEDRKRTEAARAARKRDPEEARLGPRVLQLRCTACGRTGEYEFAAEALATLMAFDGAEKRGETLPSKALVTCKHCGVNNAYEVTPFSRISAAGGMKALAASRKKGPPPS
jgi:hypothetical protein